MHDVERAGLTIFGPLDIHWAEIATLLGVAALGASARLRRDATQAIRYFVASNVYLATLFAAMAIDGLL